MHHASRGLCRIIGGYCPCQMLVMGVAYATQGMSIASKSES